MVFGALVDYFIRKQAKVITKECPTYPAVSLYNVHDDVMEWADCTDTAVIAALAGLGEERINSAAADLNASGWAARVA